MNYPQQLEHAHKLLQSRDGFLAPSTGTVELNDLYDRFNQAYRFITDDNASDRFTTDQTTRPGIVALRRAAIAFGHFNERDGYYALPLVDVAGIPRDQTAYVPLMKHAAEQFSGFNQADGLFGYDFEFADGESVIGVLNPHEVIAPKQYDALLSLTDKIGLRVLTLPLSSDSAQVHLFANGTFSKHTLPT